MPPERRQSVRLLEKRPSSGIEKATKKGAAGGGARAALVLSDKKTSRAAGSGAKAVHSLTKKTTGGTSSSTGLTNYMQNTCLDWGEPTAGASRPQTSQQKEASSKYPKKQILALHAVFRQIDKNGSGTISLGEMRRGLEKEKHNVTRVDGLEHSLAERNRAASYLPSQHNGHRRVSTTAAFLDALSESMFAALDKDKNGEATFRELLLLMYPRASQAELETMCSWVEAAVEAPQARQLSAEQEIEVRRIFAMYDTDRSGGLSVPELVKALRSTGLSPHEVLPDLAVAEEPDLLHRPS